VAGVIHRSALDVTATRCWIASVPRSRHRQALPAAHGPIASWSSHAGHCDASDVESAPPVTTRTRPVVGGPCRGVSISGDIGVPITRTDVQGSHQPV